MLNSLLSVSNGGCFKRHESLICMVDDGEEEGRDRRERPRDEERKIE